MKKIGLIFILSLLTSFAFAQTGHIMQGVGALNMSMGGASTAQPLDISGALQWNPASISVFDEKIMNFDLGIFFSSPNLSSTLPAGMLGPGAPSVSGETKDARGISPMPAFAMVWGKKDSKHTFGVSLFGISGFGVTFPEEKNNPLSPTFNPTINSNPANYPQQAGGFGRLRSNYMLMQTGFTYAYKLSDKFSIGIEPTIDFSILEVDPNPIASPSPTLGYPESDAASALGFGGQVGIFYNSGSGFKLGVAYKTEQSFGKFDFKGTYLDGSKAPNVKFKMNYPAIFSVGLGYSAEKFDFALDYRTINYENAEGFAEKGWTNTASVAGFGWQNIDIISAGLQLKLIDKLPLRFGYTYSGNPINSDLAMFSIEATAIIKNAFQFGFGYELSDNLTLNGVYHHGSSDGKTSGPLLNPLMITPSNPNGAIPGSSVAYDMKTDLIMFGFSYKFIK
ncbi:MAG: hydrocarbon degradation protein [Flavobacteriaceae bacterium CG1_02_35_72]|nr:MAG: hydrocarbon degradation protein [Flavobacteriaceae bacterium CG1_02_35_72]PIR14691.1 MAG: hydrocarbon degradation protein [Flavobacteriales bacterium CG11_big_fil_rev_8_21_14_0_20_35_7]PJA05561.1 MAG: hydrocarbon degradation protein [Flavobacteriales bacterium CG_4_10_14_0_2_um_filter_35_18]